MEVIINSSKFNSEGLGDKQFPYNPQLDRKHPRQLGTAATLDEMTRSYKLKGLGPKNDPSQEENASNVAANSNFTENTLL